MKLDPTLGTGELPGKPMPTCTITTLVSFPPGTFFENMSVRADNSILVTLHENKQLYYVPPGPSPTALLLKEFEHCTLGIAQIETDEYFISTSDPAKPQSSTVWRLDLNGWTPGDAVTFDKVVDIPDAKWLNGTTVLNKAKRVLLLADSVAACIWRVDVEQKTAKVWLQDDETMKNTWPAPYDAAPGVNGVHYNANDGKVYYTLTVPGLFASIAVDKETLETKGDINVVCKGIPGADDFLLDLERGGAWIATHTSNGIDFVSFEGEHNTLVGGAGSEYVGGLGGDFVPDVIGTTAMVWSRAPGEMGKVMFVTTEGGISYPPDGTVRDGKILRVELH